MSKMRAIESVKHLRPKDFSKPDDFQTLFAMQLVRDIKLLIITR